LSDYDALLTAITLGGLTAAVLVVRGNLSIILRRRPQPRKTTSGES